MINDIIIFTDNGASQPQLEMIPYFVSKSLHLTISFILFSIVENLQNGRIFLPVIYIHEVSYPNSFKYLAFNCTFCTFGPQTFIRKGSYMIAPVVGQSTILSETSLDNFLLFCIKMVHHKVSKLRRRFFRKNVCPLQANVRIIDVTVARL